MHSSKILEGEQFKPESIFTAKIVLTLITILTAVLIGIIGLFSMIGFFSSLDNDPTDDNFSQFLNYHFPNLLFLYIILSLIIIVIGVILADYYTKTMEFRILDKEIIVKKGIINKEEKHIPFRTITNVSSRYGIYDRFFRIGTVQIETAGKSGQQTGPEAKIEGIYNYIDVRDIILKKLRLFRGQYATTTELEPSNSVSIPITEQDFHQQLLTEIREIKELLSK